MLATPQVSYTIPGQKRSQLRSSDKGDVADSEVHLKRAPSYRLLRRDVSAQPHMSVAAVQFQSRFERIRRSPSAHRVWPSQGWSVLPVRTFAANTASRAMPT